MTDFLIIGGGIAGVSAGSELAKLGRVTLLEMESALGYHASGRSAALYEQRYGLPSTIALSAASADALWDREVLQDRGLMLVGGLDQISDGRREAEQMEMLEIGLDAAQKIVPILNPETVGFVAHHRETWDIDTDKLIQSFARDIRQNGQIVTGVTVESIERTQNGWRVHAGGREWTADIVVNAAGPWADHVASLAQVSPIGLQPKRRSMARIPAPGGFDVAQWPMMLGVGERWYAKPDAGAFIVSPAEEHDSAPMDAWADDMVIAEGLARYEHHVTEPVTRLETTWAGLRSFSPDRNLVLGPDPQVPSFVWVAGQGGYGFQSAPAAGRLVADLVGGRSPELASDIVMKLSPGRFQ